MKRPILICLFFALATVICRAQNPSIEFLRDYQTGMYRHGVDSVHFNIVGKNDTIQRTDFFRSGKVASIHWREDSSHIYDELGQIKDKYFSKTENGIKRDSSISFYRNGKQKEIASSSDGYSVRKVYAENGAVLMTVVENYTESLPNHRFIVGSSRTYDRFGIPIHGMKSELKYEGKQLYNVLYDTVFSEAGIPLKTIEDIRPDSITPVGTHYLTDPKHQSDGYDTLYQNVFKDNLNCLYGVHNKRGDTIIKPLFDRIELIRERFWVAHSGEILQLYKLNGERVLPASPYLTYIEANKSDYKNDRDNVFIKDVDKLERARLSERFSSGFIPYQMGIEEPPKKKIEYIEIDKSSVDFYSITDNDKFGVIDENGQIVLPPQSLPLTNRNVGNGLYFEYEEFKENQWRETGFIDRQGKRLFQERFTITRHTNYKDYFTLALYPIAIGSGTNFDVPYNSIGLSKAGGEVVLPFKFSSIEHVPFTDFFIAEVTHKQDKNPNDTLYQRIKNRYSQGIFNVETKKWILDTLGGFHVINPAEPNHPFFIIKNAAKNKSGILDTIGKLLLPCNYDLVTLIDVDDHTYWLKKGKSYQFLDIKDGIVNLHKPKYDFLFPFTFDMHGYSETEYIHYFFAKRGNKWGIVDAFDKIIAPFEFDYATNPNDKAACIILVKNGQAQHYTLSSLPNSDPIYSFKKDPTEKSILYQLSLVDDNNRVYLVNDSGKVVLPPQYKLLYYDERGKFAHIQDKNARKKLIFLETGKMIDFPFDYSISEALPNCRALVVEDIAQNGFGVVSTEGKILVPCNNYSIAISDIETATLFVKRDTPVTWWSRFSEENLHLPQSYTDTLSQEDNNWLMYNGNGQKLSDAPFRFPIDFKHGLGIGMKEAGFNLYNTEGVIVSPFTRNTEGVKNLTSDEKSQNQGYPNIRRDKKLDFYTFFYNQGLTPIVILTDKKGEILVESGRYDGISKFYDKYALATSEGKVALIDSFGREVIAPQNLRIYSGNFIDSLDILNKIYHRKYDTTGISVYDSLTHLPLDFGSQLAKFTHPDSLNITDFQRASLWNLMLEKCLTQTILTANEVKIPRVEHIRGASQLSAFEEEYRNRKDKTPYRVTIADSTIAFCLNDNTKTGKSLEFYNFYRRNNRWEELKINDVLQIQGEKRWQMNDLITQKIKALKDQQIDCSNAAAFITTAETRWLLTKEGIEFCFDSTNYSSYFVVISFTWAELQPFLKMKIF